MTDRDSINLEQLYAQSNAHRQIQQEWDEMSTRIIAKHGDQLVTEGVLEEGIWDSIKSGAGKVAGAVSGAVGAAGDAIKTKLMMPIVKMLQQKFPEAFEKLTAWVQQNPNAKDFSQIADKGVTESLYQYTRPFTEDVSHKYPLDEWWAEANRVERRGQLENAWALFDGLVEESSWPDLGFRSKEEMRQAFTEAGGRQAWMVANNVRKVDEANPQGLNRTAAGGETPGGRLTTVAPGAERLQGVASDRFTGNARQDVSALKAEVDAFLAANPNMAKDGRFTQLQDTISKMDREGRFPGEEDGEAGGGTPGGGDVPGVTTLPNPGPSTDGGPDAGGADPGAAGAAGAAGAGGDAGAAGAAGAAGELGAGGAAGAEGEGEGEAQPGGEEDKKSGGMLSRAWDWIKKNPGKAAGIGGLAALFLFVGLTPVTFLGLLRGLGTGIAQGAAMADPDVAGQVVNTTMQGDF